MMRFKNSLRCVPMRLSLLVCLLAMSLSAMADNYTYNADNYTAYQAGNDAVRFTLPTGNTSGTNDGVQQGRVSIIVDGGARQTVFDWHCVDYSNVDTKGCYIQASQGGKFELVWTVPRELRGKNLKIYVWAHVNWSAAGDWHVPNANSSKLLLDWDCRAYAIRPYDVRADAVVRPFQRELAHVFL